MKRLKKHNQTENMKKIIAIIGTNASGKSALGIKLAQAFNGEIISADSRQVFKGLDLGSGKVTLEEMQGIPHYMIDIAEPGDFFSMADFQRMSYKLINDIHHREKLPFIVGGTGLYIDSVLDGYLLSDCMPDLEYRKELEQESTEALYDKLVRLKPDVIVDKNNRNRVMRILEKIHDGDNVVPAKKKKYASLRIGVSWPRAVLATRIHDRLITRLKEGLIEEVDSLIKKGVSTEFLIGLGLEYKFITLYLIGEFSDKQEMIEKLEQAIRKFAKRQMTWFKRNSDIIWLNMEKNPEEQAITEICRFLDI